MNISAGKRNVAVAVGKTALVLFVAVAALTSAVNDLNRVAGLATSAGLFTFQLLDAGLLTANGSVVGVAGKSLQIQRSLPAPHSRCDADLAIDRPYRASPDLVSNGPVDGFFKKKEQSDVE